MIRIDLLNVRLLNLKSWHDGAMRSAIAWQTSLSAWRNHGQDPGGAEARCERARDEALYGAGIYLSAIREKLRRVELLPDWSPPSPPLGCLRYGSLLGPDYYRLVPEPLLHGVPDSERIYSSDYLARHPEMQMRDERQRGPGRVPPDVQREAADLTRSILRGGSPAESREEP